MTVQELKEKIDAILEMNPRAGELNLCIPNNKKGMMGGLPVTYIQGISQGIDWDSKKMFIWPEVNMINE